MGVISLRLKDRDLERLDELSKLERKDRSTTARELLEYGWEFLMVRYYKEGKLSLEGLAKKLDISISEAIDLLAKLGIEAPIEFEDYLKGLNVFKDRYYKEGKLSLEGLAKKLDISISEAIDLLAKLGIEAPIEFEDYLKGLNVFKDK